MILFTKLHLFASSQAACYCLWGVSFNKTCEQTEMAEWTFSFFWCFFNKRSQLTLGHNCTHTYRCTLIQPVSFLGCSPAWQGQTLKGGGGRVIDPDSVERKPERSLWAGQDVKSWQTPTVWVSPACVRTSGRQTLHRQSSAVLSSPLLFSKDNHLVASWGSNLPSSFCPQTNCLGIKITADSVRGSWIAGGTQESAFWSASPLTFSLSFSFDQTPRSRTQWGRAVSSKQCDSEVNAWLNWTGVRGLCLCVSACDRNIKPHKGSI